jgi:hypothetical protein
MCEGVLAFLWCDGNYLGYKFVLLWSPKASQRSKTDESIARSIFATILAKSLFREYCRARRSVGEKAGSWIRTGARATGQIRVPQAVDAYMRNCLVGSDGDYKGY